ncbi:hypothetical protein ABZP36_012183 [Zizania latifolia]
MRIRKCASRLLGSSYFSPAPPVPAAAPGFELPLPLTTTTTPPPPPYPVGATESRGGGVCFAPATASAEPCELSRSPWDLIGELDLSDPQEGDLVDKFFVHVACRASWLFPTSSSGPTTGKAEEGLAAGDEFSTKPQKQKATKRIVKKPPAKKKEVEKEGEEESELKKRVKTKKEEVAAESAAVVASSGEAQVWTCKKNDGKRWHCQRRVSQPNSLCDYHFEQKRSYYNPLYECPSEAAPTQPAYSPPWPAPSKPSSKPSASSKARKKKVGDAGEGFYYYTGFGPFRTKRHCRSSNMQESTHVEQEEQEQRPENDAAPSAGKPRSEDDSDHQPLAARDDLSSSDSDDIAGIAGGDEESSDDARINGGNGGLRAGINGDTKKKSQVRKRWRKPVKARSLKSLM